MMPTVHRCHCWTCPLSTHCPLLSILTILTSRIYMGTLHPSVVGKGNLLAQRRLCSHAVEMSACAGRCCTTDLGLSLLLPHTLRSLQRLYRQEARELRFSRLPSTVVRFCYALTSSLQVDTNIQCLHSVVNDYRGRCPQRMSGRSPGRLPLDLGHAAVCLLNPVAKCSGPDDCSPLPFYSCRSLFPAS